MLSQRVLQSRFGDRSVRRNLFDVLSNKTISANTGSKIPNIALVFWDKKSR